uniref:Peptidase S54 rhomboid domain-containing protein n=1 Tax=Opuntia streptacantha TaxID=393608 RepID=A0A7C9EEJ8_OPUST
MSFLLEIRTLAFLKDANAVITSGPYVLVFASFVPFFFEIPISTRFRVLGVQCPVHFSDKTFIYLAGLQLLLVSWKRSILPGICGLIAGSLYCMNMFYIRRAKFPDLIASLFSRFSWPSTGRSRSALRRRNVLCNMPSNAGRSVEGWPCYFTSCVKGF